MMMFEHADRVLAWSALVSFGVGLVCLGAFLVNATPILGVHPAFKPMKFGISIALFLGTMALILPCLSISADFRQATAWLLSLTMLAELLPIVAQPLRGTTSHFNTQGAFNAAAWQIMMGAIVLATLTMVSVALAATVRPLHDPSGQLMSSFRSTAWRAGLWLFLLAAVSGFAMGGRLRHSVGGNDGGPGLPLVNWSTSHGDLRVSHFIALHALQGIPLVGAALAWMPMPAAMKWTALLLVIGLTGLTVVGTLLQAFAARPLW